MIRLTIILFILLSACKPDTRHSVKLDDNIGLIEIELPTYFDTTFTWYHFSDYTCSEIKKYRFQPSNIEICQETGWLYQCNPKEKISFTVEHLPKKCWKRAFKNSYKKYLDGQVKSLQFLDQRVEFLIKETKIISGRNFNILGYKLSKPNSEIGLVATTFLDSTYLKLTFLNTSDTSQLDIKKMYQYLKSLNCKL